MRRVTAQQCATTWGVSPSYARRLLAPLQAVGRDLETGALLYDQTQADGLGTGRKAGHPGAISAHFLHSADGSRVLLYTGWTSVEAHQEAAEAGHHDEGHEIFSSTPGVRPTGGGGYHLHRSLSLPRP
ncbi:hypothetical protein ACFO9E_22035 [Streptomyces maoxianensis]|uniref:Monooxygenase n=1 Tax=Streptomyces maoxianensis TaxID=1459942 RepID=A0ABV9G861_9ACTN